METPCGNNSIWCFLRLADSIFIHPQTFRIENAFHCFYCYLPATLRCPKKLRTEERRKKTFDRKSVCFMFSTSK